MNSTDNELILNTQSLEFLRMTIHNSIHVGFLFFFLYISLEIEVGKHQKEHGPVEQDDVAVVLGEVTVYHQRKGRMHEEGSELYQLHGGQISKYIRIFGIRSNILLFSPYLFHHRYFCTLGPMLDMK